MSDLNYFIRITEMNRNENIINERTLVSVTKVYRSKASGLLAHAGLELTFEMGSSLFLHTAPDKNVQLSTVDDFLDGEVLVRKKEVKATDKIIIRIKQKLLKNPKYSWFDNCEHLASGVLTGKATSAQLNTAFAFGAAGVTLLACNTNNRKLSTLSLGALGFGLLGLYIAKNKQLAM
jgi:hypothetical protein